ncbi:hypothetical protein N7495_004194 [Penicillium taxi]|uniref:uncharacterized protein n=1 Tax=Penicillium taxi TaxID=168475 RepID=UPI002545BD17|nr:uncharacterized protein N7495_004194 [Penicillium taxi]KAJ5899450.1 hypothetical protein N7495_004194 [Penicillium taxi]
MSATEENDAENKMKKRDDRTIPPLFANKRFFLAFNIPKRENFKRNLQAHSGVIVKLEKDADIILLKDLKAPNVQADTCVF